MGKNQIQIARNIKNQIKRDPKDPKIVKVYDILGRFVIATTDYSMFGDSFIRVKTRDGYKLIDRMGRITKDSTAIGYDFDMYMNGKIDLKELPVKYFKDETFRFVIERIEQHKYLSLTATTHYEKAANKQYEKLLYVNENINKVLEDLNKGV